VVIIDARGTSPDRSRARGIARSSTRRSRRRFSRGVPGGTLATGPLTIRREASVRAASGLAFPGKVFADAEAGRLYVADSNHNRVVIAEMPNAQGRARLIRVVGAATSVRTTGRRIARRSIIRRVCAPVRETCTSVTRRTIFFAGLIWRRLRFRRSWARGR